jgi:hypothetical protein
MLTLTQKTIETEKKIKKNVILPNQFSRDKQNMKKNLMRW